MPRLPSYEGKGSWYPWNRQKYMTKPQRFNPPSMCLQMWWKKEEKLLPAKVRLRVSIVVTELEFQVSFNSELTFNKSTYNTKAEIWISVAKTHTHRRVILQHAYLSQWGFVDLALSPSWTTTHFHYLWMNTQHTYSHPPYLEDDSSNHNLRIHHATGDKSLHNKGIIIFPPCHILFQQLD